MIINPNKAVPLIGGGFVGGAYWRGIKRNRENRSNRVQSNIFLGYKAVVRLIGYTFPRRWRGFTCTVMFETVLRPVGNDGNVEPWYHRWVNTIAGTG